ERRTYRGVNHRLHLGIVEAILRLPLELRLSDEHAQDAGEALTDIVRSKCHTTWSQFMCLDVVAYSFRESCSQTRLVGSTRRGRNAVDVAPEVFVSRLGPLQSHLDARPVLSAQVKGWTVYG